MISSETSPHRTARSCAVLAPRVLWSPCLARQAERTAGQFRRISFARTLAVHELGMVERSRELSTLKSAIAPLAERVLAVDIRAYESMSPERVAGDLSPIVAELLSAATRLVSEVLRAYEALGADADRRVESDLAPPHVPFEHAIDAAIDAQATSSIQAVGDIAFLANLELRQRAERLHRVTAHGRSVAIVEECDSAL